MKIVSWQDAASARWPSSGIEERHPDRYLNFCSPIILASLYLIRQLRLWQDRAQYRNFLRECTFAEFQEMGVPADFGRKEAGKPFWRT